MNNAVLHCPDCGLELSSQMQTVGCPRCLLQAAVPETHIDEAGSTHHEGAADGDLSSQESGAPVTGEFFGEFELLEELAQGGMGTIYRARQTRLNREVALKTIRKGEFAGETDIERFYSEAEAAAGISCLG